MAQALLPRYAQAQTISFTDPRIKATLRELSLAGRHVGHDARLSGAAERAGAVPDRAGDPREPRAQSLHRGRGAPRCDRRLPRAGAGRAVRRSAAIPATTTTAARCRRGSTRRKLRTDMLNSARYLKAHRSRPASSASPASAGAAARPTSSPPRLGADMHAGVPFYGAAAADRARAEDQGAAADPVRRDRRAHQRDVAGVRGGAEGATACVRDAHLSRHAARLPQQLDAALQRGRRRSSRGSARSRSSRSIWRRLRAVAAVLPSPLVGEGIAGSSTSSVG